MKANIRITIIGIVFSSFIFCIKLVGGILSGSLALMSDSLHSFVDIMSAIVIFFAVRIGTKKADSDHPFGHHRAEPIAGLIMAILVAILGFEIIKSAFQGFFERRSLDIDLTTFIIVITSIVVQVYLFILFRINGKRYRSPAILATSVEYINNMLTSVSVLIGVIFGYLGYPLFDSIVALMIGILVVYLGFRIGIKNVDFLMGKKPDDELIERHKEIALSIDGVKDLHDVRAHYLGNFLQIEVHIEVDKRLSTEKSHEIATNVQNRLEKEEIIDYAFVHVDPT